MKILVTGGLGFIGSHTVVELIKENNEVIIVDNLYNSKEEVLEKLKEITGNKIKLYKYDLKEKEKIEKIFKENDIDAVIHFAGYKAVGESVKKPLMYYSNNLITTTNLLEVMQEHNVKNFVFSSSATVYGEQKVPKYVETMKRGETSSPYGTTKAMIEKVLEDLYESDKSWNISILRYFNPVGAHESGLIGEEPNGIPNNLMPYVMKVASGKLETLSIFGNDYPTKDGTGVRDYIHVVDLAKGHVSALNKASGLNIYNLGSGQGVSVLELVTTFEKVNNIKVNYQFVERRPGDLPEYYADPSKAYKELGWKTEKTLEDICRDTLNYEVISTQNQKLFDKEGSKIKTVIDAIDKLQDLSEKETKYNN